MITQRELYGALIGIVLIPAYIGIIGLIYRIFIDVKEFIRYENKNTYTEDKK